MMSRYRSLYFAVFALSGFSGLIYESIWTHYLKLFLGHAAYAQTLVLAIFMGGLSLGSYLCSIYSVRWKDLLAGYAVVEAVIGLCALVFHFVFDRAVGFSYSSVMPWLGSPAAATIFKWSLSAVLILPQSVLLGMTFPLMTGGVLRSFPARPGQTVSMLYFTNSIGAVFGVLVSGFLLIRLVGLPWTMGIAGIMNLVVAGAVWRLSRKHPAGEPALPASAAADRSSEGAEYLVFLAVALITGLTSFCYEIGWIRMLSLVLGSSNHSFELMLSAFILGLALGGLWVQRRIDRIASPVLMLAAVQIAMGVLAVATLPAYGASFGLMQWLMKIIPGNDWGYLVFNLAGHGIASMVMVPATFCAGMTLPLITFTLLRRGYGERSVGAVYAFNTVGAIAGVFIAVHAGMPSVGLKGLISLGGLLDAALGLALLLWVREEAGSLKRSVAAGVAGIAVIGGIFAFMDLDPYLMASGVYRTGIIKPGEARLLYHRDGKTATISIVQFGDRTRDIRTNGKSDAMLSLDPAAGVHPDEYTMALAAAIPMSYKPGARTVANIGLGSGLTTNTLLTNPDLSVVETVEIEKNVLDAARYFGDRVSLAFDDPRSRIHIDDAKTFFSSNHRSYDIIISEPSNPWVSGVAGLFSVEFYRLIRSHLARDGIFAQWLQMYEINEELVASVLKALSSVFPDYVVFAPNFGDLLIIAGDDVSTRGLSPSLFSHPLTEHSLRQIGIWSVQDLEVRRVGDRRMLQGLISAYPIRMNSDYYPVLDQYSAKTRVLRSSAQDLISFIYQPLPAVEMLSKNDRLDLSRNIMESDSFRKTQDIKTAQVLKYYFRTGQPTIEFDILPESVKAEAGLFRKAFLQCGPVQASQAVDLLFNTGITLSPYLSPSDSDILWDAVASRRCPASSGPDAAAWMKLFRAIGRRDAAAMAEISATILKSPALSEAKRRYLLASAMLGSMADGRRQQALDLWETFSPDIFKTEKPGMLFRLLVSNASADQPSSAPRQ